MHVLVTSWGMSRRGPPTRHIKLYALIIFFVRFFYCSSAHAEAPEVLSSGEVVRRPWVRRRIRLVRRSHWNSQRPATRGRGTEEGMLLRHSDSSHLGKDVGTSSRRARSLPDAGFPLGSLSDECREDTIPSCAIKGSCSPSL